MSDEAGVRPIDEDARVLLNAKLDVIRQRFVAGFDHRLAELVTLALVCAASDGVPGSAPETARQALARGLHSLAGSAPTIGLASLGQRARALEVQLAQITERGAAPGADFLQALNALGPLAKSGAN